MRISFPLTHRVKSGPINRAAAYRRAGASRRGRCERARRGGSSGWRFQAGQWTPPPGAPLPDPLNLPSMNCCPSSINPGRVSIEEEQSRCLRVLLRRAIYVVCRMSVLFITAAYTLRTPNFSTHFQRQSSWSNRRKRRNSLSRVATNFGKVFPKDFVERCTVIVSLPRV